MATSATTDVSSHASTTQVLFSTSLTADVIHNRGVNFPPDFGYHPIPSHVFDRNLLGLELQYATREDISGLMAALPQWNIPPSPEAVDPKPWRIIWAYPSHEHLG